ncbi:MAG: ABC transporter ATP-binding protein, partial [Bacteroidota bacterium]
NTMVQENLNGIRTVVAYANEEHEIERFEKQNLAKLKIGLKHNLLHTWFWPSSDMLSHLQMLMAIMVGGYFTMQGRITLGELLSFYTYIVMVTWPIRNLGRILSEMGMAAVALSRLSEILGASQEELKEPSETGLKGDIEFRSVSFGYKQDDGYALSKVSFKIQSGEKVAIIGPSGSGKSTLIKLLLRLYEPTEGEIFLDGKPITQFSREYLRLEIGLALQQPFLFSTTILGNIAYTEPGSSIEQVHAAAKAAQAYELQGIMPQGLETVVGEKGVTLSGGQKQRVALARTLLPQPGLLILDDVTSAVDTETEHAIFDALDDWLADKTTLIISHRVTSIQQADRVLVLEDGKLVQEGSPEQLAETPGYYQEIHQIQAAVEAELDESR